MNRQTASYWPIGFSSAQRKTRGCQTARLYALLLLTLNEQFLFSVLKWAIDCGIHHLGSYFAFLCTCRYRTARKSGIPIVSRSNSHLSPASQPHQAQNGKKETQLGSGLFLPNPEADFNGLSSTGQMQRRRVGSPQRAD